MEKVFLQMLYDFKKYSTIVKNWIQIEGLLDGPKLGCSVGSSVGRKEGVIVGALEGRSASKEMPIMR